MSDKTVIYTKYGDFDGVAQLFKYMLKKVVKKYEVRIIKFLRSGQYG